MLEALYRKYCGCGWAISGCLPRLRTLAETVDRVVEFGVKRGASTTAFLLGARQSVTSYDIEATREGEALARGVPGWTYRILSSLEAPVQPCDLIFFDSLHTYDQLTAELARHGQSAERYLVFHDVTTFGEVAAKGETGLQAWTYVAARGSCPREAWGIRPAIDAFMIAHPEWHIYYRDVSHHGLLVLHRDA